MFLSYFLFVNHDPLSHFATAVVLRNLSRISLSFLNLVFLSRFRLD